MKSSLQKIWDKTTEIVVDNERLNKLITQANEKLRKVAEKDESKRELFDSVKIIIRMVRSQLSGEYDAFSAKSLFLLVFALLYFVIPTDMIPDFIPLIGFTDDITVLYYVVSSLAEDISLYREWENEMS